MPDLWLASQSECINVLRQVPIYTDWWQRNVCVCVNNLPKVTTAEQRGIEATTSNLQVQYHNHQTTIQPRSNMTQQSGGKRADRVTFCWSISQYELSKVVWLHFNFSTQVYIICQQDTEYNLMLCLPSPGQIPQSRKTVVCVCVCVCVLCLPIWMLQLLHL